LECWRVGGDFRQNSKNTALFDEEQWRECLERTDFTSISALELSTFSGIVCAKNEANDNNLSCITSIKSTSKKWFLLDDCSEICKHLAESVRMQGREIMALDIHTSNSTEVVSQIMSLETQHLEGIICFWTQFSSTTVPKIQSQMLTTLLSAMKNYEVLANKLKRWPKFVLITRGVYNIGETKPGNPTGATAWGLLKVLRNENPLAQIALIDLDPEPTPFEFSQVFAQIWDREDELFVALRENKTFVLRLTYMDNSRQSIQLPNTDRYKFINPASGAFTDIEIGPMPREEPQDGEAEILVRACGLNFRDLFMVLKPEGFNKSFEDPIRTADSVGLDFAGIVVKVGPGVSRFKIGDRVFGLTDNGALKSHILVSEMKLIKIPEFMSYEAASAVSIAFLTALFSLIDVAKVTASDRVLVHVASGGVGLAAIQVLQHIGAEIYATAGNQRKRAYLQSLGIKFVYNSRDTSYGVGIERDTNGAGVTVVLNSLTGPNFKETSLAACARGARFVEIGKMNIWQPNEVKSLRPDVKYTIIDLSLKDSQIEKLSGTKFDTHEQLLQIEKYVTGETFHELPCEIYPLAQVREAFYNFQKARHIGKIVVKFPECTLAESGKIEHKHMTFNAESSYLITGGLGGIGVHVAKWMLSAGAKTIILLGRSLPSETVQSLIDNWNRDGSRVVVMQADIGEYGDCQDALNCIKMLHLPPLRGIMHAAGVILDAVVREQTAETLETVLRPKVYGGWYLHTLTLNYHMEFFVMFSSISVVLGLMHQCNYGAANRFLDSLAHYRVAMGLPGTTINWGK